MQVRNCVIPFVAMAALSLSAVCAAQSAPADRIVSAIVPSQRTMTNAVNPLATKQNDIGHVEGSRVFHRLVLVLQRSPQQETALKQLLEEQQDPKSAEYHKWLTPAEFGQQFGPSDDDMAKIEGWLKSEGFSVEQPPNGRQYLIFTGTSAQVDAAFQTQMDNFKVSGKTYIANATAASIPTALAPDVRGVASLSSFNSEEFTPTIHPAATPKIELATGLLTGPADVDAIYDATPLQKASIEGQGESIALIEESNINPQDVADFRTATGLPAANLNVIVNGTDPGLLAYTGDEFEAVSDAEWSGAVDPDATLNVIVSASTEFVQGIDYSAMYAVDYDVSQITAMSYGGCETYNDLSEGTYLFGLLYEQGAAEGISQFVSAGDNGGDACQFLGISAGYGVNGIGDSPWNVSVGGTEFIMPDPSVYFPNGAATGYIPESTWNDYQNPYDGRPLAGGGGPSVDWGKPAWQAGPGVPADGARDVPDVSLLAGDNLAYMTCESDIGYDCAQGYAGGVIGTSISNQVWAGIQALVNQKNGLVNGAGNPNPTYYQLAAGTNSPFHDITIGNTKVPDPDGQLVGYTATPGYDLATGLGSVDINNLATDWMPPTGSGTATATLSDGGVATITHGDALTVNLTVTGNGSKVPSGNVVYMAGTQGVMQDTLSSSGTDSFSFGPTSEQELPGGSYKLTARYAGDTNYAPATSNAIALTVNAEPTTTEVGASVKVAIPYGDPVTVGAAAYGTNSGTGYPVPGTYSFTDTSTGAKLGTASLADTGESFAFLNSQGSADLTLSGATALGAGTHAVVAASPANASFQASTSSPVTILVDTSSPLVSLTPDHTTPALNSTVNLLVSVLNVYGTDVPATGTVTVWNESTSPATALGTATLASTPDSEGAFDATIPVKFTTAGVYPLVATYSGDANDNSNYSGAVDVTAGGKASSTTEIMSAPYDSLAGTNVTIVAGVTGDSSGTAPTGTVTFTDASASNGAGAVLGTEPLAANGTATLTINTLTAGTHAIVASYSGDANYASSIAQGVTINIGDFTFSSSSSSVSMTSGQSSTAITLSFSGTEYLNVGAGVQLSCSGLPTGAACNFSTTTMQPTENSNGTSSGTATVTITTTGPTLQKAALKRPRKPLGGGSGIPLSLAGLLALGLPLAWRKRKLFGSMLGLALLAVLVSMNGCGSSGPQQYTISSAGTPAGTSTVSVMATVSLGSETLTHTATVTLNVTAAGTPAS